MKLCASDDILSKYDEAQAENTRELVLDEAHERQVTIKRAQEGMVWVGCGVRRGYSPTAPAAYIYNTGRRASSSCLPYPIRARSPCTRSPNVHLACLVCDTRATCWVLIGSLLIRSSCSYFGISELRAKYCFLEHSCRLPFRGIHRVTRRAHRARPMFCHYSAAPQPHKTRRLWSIRRAHFILGGPARKLA